jgi:hypothetical protein
MAVVAWTRLNNKGGEGKGEGGRQADHQHEKKMAQVRSKKGSKFVIKVTSYGDGYSSYCD